MGSRTSMLSCFHSHRSSGWAADQIQFGGKKNCWNLFVACQIYFQFSTVAVQIQPAGKTNWWNLFVACQIYFQFSTVAVQIQPAGKTNCWNLFVACQIFSIFHSSSTDSTCRQNKLVEPVCCMSNIFNFPQ